MSSRAKKEVHVEDLPVADYPAWLAGMLEVAGSMRFHTKQRGDKVRTDPLIRIGDNSSERAIKTKELVGGRVHIYSFPAEGREVSWQIQGYAAAQIAQLIEPFSPARKPTIDAYRRWEESVSTEDRVAIATAFARAQQIVEVTPEDYQSLVEDPDFVAGVVDARGVMNVYQKGGRPEKILSISSKNRALVDALQLRFGGGILSPRNVGDQHQFRGRVVTVQEESYVWTITQRQLARFMPFVADHLRLRQPPEAFLEPYTDIAKEKKELDVQDFPVSETPAWLAGMLETRGAVTFDVHPSKNSTREGKMLAYPMIKINEHDVEKLTKVQEIAGGTRTGSFWCARSHFAIQLGELMEPFTLSRKRAIDAFREWEHALTLADRVVIARAFLDIASSPDEPPTAKDYERLVAEPEFTAGLVDAKGSHYDTSDGQRRYAMTSTNGPLLEALKHTYGGSLSIHTQMGTSYERRGRTTSVVKKDSYSWVVKGRTVDKLLNHIASFLRLRVLPETEDSQDS